MPGELGSSDPHEHAPDAVVDTYVVDGGRLLLTLWHGRPHEVIYQTPGGVRGGLRAARRPAVRALRTGPRLDRDPRQRFRQDLSPTDQRRYALWSHALDFTAFGTMEFPQVKW
ncbi:hypothetical protein [Streptomyces sp. NPDC005438]|uniref:hypothetical protein n=1 Tax=Streptomyces sp. NPDC005438 TaxID=3156880 RepID=UPI0033A2C594